jgi:hypothetical protein
VNAAIVRPVTAEPNSWVCDGCQKEGDELAGRFRCVEGCNNFDLCLACWSMEVAEPPPHVCSFVPKPKRPLPTTSSSSKKVPSSPAMSPQHGQHGSGSGNNNNDEGFNNNNDDSISNEGATGVPVTKRRASTGPRPPSTPPLLPQSLTINSGHHDMPSHSLPSSAATATAAATLVTTIGGPPGGAHHHQAPQGTSSSLTSTANPGAISAGAASSSSVSGSISYDGALKQLNEMGFTDGALNLKYLRQKNGNVDAVLQLLLSLPPA